MRNQKQLKSRKGGYRCERCWSENNINLFPRSQFLGEDAKGFVILCERCKYEAPSKKEADEFENLFLRFASTKEFIQHYNEENEHEARELWKREMEGKQPESDNSPKITEKETESIGIGDEKTPFGYELNQGRLTVNQGKKKLIMGIYESYLSGKTMEKIARDLSHKKEFGTWSLNEIREILKDPTYAGYKFHGTEVVKADHEALIEPEIFNKVQRKIVRNIRNPKYLYKPLELTG